MPETTIQAYFKACGITGGSPAHLAAYVWGESPQRIRRARRRRRAFGDLQTGILLARALTTAPEAAASMPSLPFSLGEGSLNPPIPRAEPACSAGNAIKENQRGYSTSRAWMPVQRPGQRLQISVACFAPGFFRARILGRGVRAFSDDYRSLFFALIGRVRIALALSGPPLCAAPACLAFLPGFALRPSG